MTHERCYPCELDHTHTTPDFIHIESGHPLCSHHTEALATWLMDGSPPNDDTENPYFPWLTDNEDGPCLHPWHLRSYEKTRTLRCPGCNESALMARQPK